MLNHEHQGGTTLLPIAQSYTRLSGRGLLRKRTGRAALPLDLGAECIRAFKLRSALPMISRHYPASSVGRRAGRHRPRVDLARVPREYSGPYLYSAKATVADAMYAPSVHGF